MNVVDAGIADNTFLQAAGNFIKDNVTSVHIVDANIADNMFFKEEFQVNLQRQQGLLQIQKAGSKYEFNKNIYKF